MAFKLRGDVVTQKPEVKAMPTCPKCKKYHSGQCQSTQPAGEAKNVQSPR